jgi:hypothetical protein
VNIFSREAAMAFSDEETIAELAALRVAVRMLLETARSSESEGFAKNALARGLAKLNDVDHWGVPEHEKIRIRTLAKKNYQDLFHNL